MRNEDYRLSKTARVAINIVVILVIMAIELLLVKTFIFKG